MKKFVLIAALAALSACADDDTAGVFTATADDGTTLTITRTE